MAREVSRDVADFDRAMDLMKAAARITAAQPAPADCRHVLSGFHSLQRTLNAR